MSQSRLKSYVYLNISLWPRKTVEIAAKKSGGTIMQLLHQFRNHYKR